jgi:putative transposase
MSGKYKIRDQDIPYFVTFTVEAWVDVFTRPLYKDLLLESIRYCQKEKGLIIYAWCLMSNHIHLIVGRINPLIRIEDIVRDLKKYSSVHICRAIKSNARESRREWMLSIFSNAAEETGKHQKYKFWTADYHPIELSGYEWLEQKLKYIHDNPVKAGIVENAEEYLYSSARDYLGRKGLLEIELM